MGIRELIRNSFSYVPIVWTKWQIMTDSSLVMLDFFFHWKLLIAHPLLGPTTWHIVHRRMHWKMYICTIPLRWESRAAAAVKCRAGQGFTNIVVEEWNRQRTIWLRRANVICIAIFECTNCFWFNPQEANEQPTTNNISAERRTECKSIAFRARRLFFFFAAAATSSSTLSSTRLEIYLFCVTFYPTCARTLTLHSLAKCNL